MAYTFSSDQHGAPLLVAGAALPQEILTLYSDDSDEEKLAMRGFWQSLHVYSRCWLVAEPLDCSFDYYKCRFSSSRKLLLDQQQSFFSLLSQEQLLTLLNAPDQPIEWEIVSDGDGNEYPVNVFGWDRTFWQPESTEECEVASLEEYKEREAVEPKDSFQEAITFAAIKEATHELLPDLPDTDAPSKKDMPIILLMAAHLTVTRNRAEAHDIYERTWLQHRAEDLSSMLEWRKVWWWNRERFIVIEPTPFAQQENSGVCLVEIGIHPDVREKRLEALGAKVSKESSRKPSNKNWGAKRSKARRRMSVA